MLTVWSDSLFEYGWNMTDPCWLCRVPGSTNATMFHFMAVEPGFATIAFVGGEGNVSSSLSPAFLLSGRTAMIDQPVKLPKSAWYTIWINNTVAEEVAFVVVAQGRDLADKVDFFVGAEVPYNATTRVRPSEVSVEKASLVHVSVGESVRFGGLRSRSGEELELQGLTVGYVKTQSYDFDHSEPVVIGPLLEKFWKFWRIGGINSGVVVDLFLGGYATSGCSEALSWTAAHGKPGLDTNHEPVTIEAGANVIWLTIFNPGTPCTVHPGSARVNFALHGLVAKFALGNQDIVVQAHKTVFWEFNATEVTGAEILFEENAFFHTLLSGDVQLRFSVRPRLPSPDDAPTNLTALQYAIKMHQAVFVFRFTNVGEVDVTLRANVVGTPTSTTGNPSNDEFGGADVLTVILTTAVVILIFVVLAVYTTRPANDYGRLVVTEV